jgi:hypothetical protein
VSQENVALILGLPTFRAGVDFVPITRDPDQAAELEAAVAALFDEDFESVFPDLIGGTKTYRGLSGMRAAWLDWLSRGRATASSWSARSTAETGW